MADDDDRSRESSSAAGPGWSDAGRPDETWARVVAPDDIRELAPDIHAYLRELRSARRRERYHGYLRRRGAMPFALVIAALALVAVATTLLTVMGPTTAGTPPTSERLATPTTPPGRLGGLLPAIALAAKDGTTVNSVTMRPGALALLPMQCDCDALLTQLDQAADASAHAPMFVVAPSSYPDTDADSLQGQLRPTDNVVYDATGALRGAVGARGLTLVFVNRDATIYDIKRNVRTTTGVHAELLSMLGETEPAS